MYMKMPLKHNKQAAAFLRIRPRIAFSQENACNVFPLVFVGSASASPKCPGKARPRRWHI